MAAKQRVIHTTAADVARRKAEIAERAVTARVIGEMPIRDAVDREDRVKGELVRLDPSDPNRPGGTLISALIDAGCIELAEAGAEA